MTIKSSVLLNRETIGHLLRLKAQAANYGLWEDGGRAKSAAHLRASFFGYLKILKPALFIEAGAHDASTSVAVKKLLPSTRVHAFEANPYNYELFRKRPELANSDIIYEHAALSDAVGEIAFNVHRSYGETELPPVSGRSSILERSDPNFSYEKVSVRSTTLDNKFSLSKDERCAIWIDVEGASRQVLLGSADLISRTDLLMIEVEDKAAWQQQWVTHDVVAHLLQSELYPVARDFEYRHQHNIVFLSARALQNPEIGVSIDYYFSVLIKS